jgi:hypothetical protein
MNTIETSPQPIIPLLPQKRAANCHRGGVVGNLGIFLLAISSDVLRL